MARHTTSECVFRHISPKSSPCLTASQPRLLRYPVLKSRGLPSRLLLLLRLLVSPPSPCRIVPTQKNKQKNKNKKLLWWGHGQIFDPFDLWWRRQPGLGHSVSYSLPRPSKSSVRNTNLWLSCTPETMRKSKKVWSQALKRSTYTKIFCGFLKFLLFFLILIYHIISSKSGRPVRILPKLTRLYNPRPDSERLDTSFTWSLFKVRVWRPTCLC